MPFVKLVKNKAYFKRYQTQYRRRREGRTDYYARRRLVVQAKNKYKTPRYRLVVRLTNHFVICQIVSSTIDSDQVLTSATSAELPRYGLTAGLKNYAAAYATGLLVARRALSKLGLADKYKGNKEVDGKVVSCTEEGQEYFVEKVDEERKPFRVVLDIGIRHTTTGARIFGAMKGAADGGLDIPHNHKRFPGYTKLPESWDPEVLKGRIFGDHVKNYMEEVQDKDSENNTDDFKKMFASYAEAGIEPAALEAVYKKVHAAIRKNPDAAHKTTSKARNTKFAADKKFKKPVKKTLAERKAAVAAKKAAAASDE